MFCEKCGKVVKGGNFCKYCGSPLEKIEVVEAEVVNQNKEKPSKKYILWETLSIIGYVFGVITFVSSFFIPFALIKYSILGIVFSFLGRKSYRNYERAEVGIKLSTASIFVSALVCFILITLYVAFFALFFFGMM